MRPLTPDEPQRIHFNGVNQLIQDGQPRRSLQVSVTYVTLASLFFFVLLLEGYAAISPPLQTRRVVEGTKLNSTQATKLTSDNSTRSCFNETDSILVCICSYQNSARSGIINDIIRTYIYSLKLYFRSTHRFDIILFRV